MEKSVSTASSSASWRDPKLTRRVLQPETILAEETLSPEVREQLSREEAPVLSRREVSRKLWHLMPGLIPFIAPLHPNFHVAINNLGEGVFRLGVIIFVVALTAITFRLSSEITRPGERRFGTAVLTYALVGILPFLLFPRHFELGMMVLSILAFGDCAAALGGIGLGGRKLPWNSGKTVAGSLSFLAFSIPAATVAYLLAMRTPPSLGQAIATATIASLCAALAESWPSRLDDNLRVGLAATGVLIPLLGMIG